MANRLYLILFLFCVSDIAFAQLTWTKDVAPILYKNCASCHRDGGIGTFSIEKYAKAYELRYAIKNAVDTRHMPPFPPDVSYQHYANERVLTSAQIKTIGDWVNQGAVEGQAIFLPTFPTAAVGSQVGKPDLILRAPTYKIKETNDTYRCFVVPTQLATGRFLSGMEVIPGNRQVVHHVLVYSDSTGASLPLDAKDPEPGYINFGGPGISNAPLVGAWVPGATTTLLPPTMGIRLPPKGYLIVQIHYPAGVTGKTDSTKINLFFTKSSTGIRQVYTLPILNHTTNMTDGPLFIPKNTVKKFHEKYKLPQEISLISVGPHMHLIGRSMKVAAVKPSGDTIRLINIPNWDFHWQGSYSFRKIVRIPIASELVSEAVYDNTMTNPWNPSNPPKDVKLGEATTDEMMLTYFTVLPYQKGDENISLETITETNELPSLASEGYAATVYPNPTSGSINLELNAPLPNHFDLNIYNSQGRFERVLFLNEYTTAGKNSFSLNVNDLSVGLYHVQLVDDSGRTIYTKFVKQ